MCVNQCNDEVSEVFQLSPFRRALVLGEGISGLLAARELIRQGFQPVIASCEKALSGLYCSAPGFDPDLFRDTLVSETRAVVRMKGSGPPTVAREGALFRAVFENGEQGLFGCLFLTGQAASPDGLDGLPEGVEDLTPDSSVTGPENVGFLLDYDAPTEPAAGMWAIRLALETMLVGGQSYVFFRHAPVSHLFGETMYEQARRSGARFVRFGARPPVVVETASGPAAGPRFTVSARDMIEGGQEMIIGCDRVLAASARERGTIPSWAEGLAKLGANEWGSRLPDSVHCHSGRLFGRGVYAVGEITGERDLIRVMGQTAAAGAHARAWARSAAGATGAETVSVEETCIRCLTCLRVCPHRAVEIKGAASRSTVSVQPVLCRECGLCMAECPRSALSAAEDSQGPLPDFAEALDRAPVAGKLAVFGCERSAGRALAGESLGEGVRFIPAPCAGRVSETIIWSALAQGATGVLVVGCHEGNCASDSGSRFAAGRIQRGLSQLTAVADMGPRVGFVTVAANEESRLRKLIEEFARPAGA